MGKSLFGLRMKRSGARGKDKSGCRVITMRAHPQDGSSDFHSLIAELLPVGPAGSWSNHPPGVTSFQAAAVGPGPSSSSASSTRSITVTSSASATPPDLPAHTPPRSDRVAISARRHLPAPIASRSPRVAISALAAAQDLRGAELGAHARPRDLRAQTPPDFRCHKKSARRDLLAAHARNTQRAKISELRVPAKVSARRSPSSA